MNGTRLSPIGVKGFEGGVGSHWIARLPGAQHRSTVDPRQHRLSVHLRLDARSPGGP
jgi:hypothetical protein